MAGGRTSVSAPLDKHPTIPAPMGREKTWIGTPNVLATENTLRKGPAPGSRGGGPLCPLRWTNIRKPRPNGQRKNLDRNPQCARHRAHPPQGPNTRVAGGRTSVSAPLDIQPKTPGPLGGPSAWIGTPSAIDRKTSQEEPSPTSAKAIPRSMEECPWRTCLGRMVFPGGWRKVT